MRGKNVEKCPGQDMNEVLMLDLSGAGLRSAPASPPGDARAPTRFSFSADRDLSGPRPPHTEPLAPAWRVAEVRLNRRPALVLTCCATRLYVVVPVGQCVRMGMPTSPVPCQTEYLFASHANVKGYSPSQACVGNILWCLAFDGCFRSMSESEEQGA